MHTKQVLSALGIWMTNFATTPQDLRTKISRTWSLAMSYRGKESVERDPPIIERKLQHVQFSHGHWYGQDGDLKREKYLLPIDKVGKTFYCLSQALLSGVSSVLDIITKAEITNGGPVILVQPENEYSLAVGDNPLTGVSNLDPNYMEWVKQQFLRNGATVPLISNDMIPLGNWAPGQEPGNEAGDSLFFLILLEPLCDEDVPACFNCARRGIICSLSGHAASLGSPGSSLSDGDGRTDPLRPDPGPVLTRLEITNPIQSPRPSIEETWGLGLELMHHYSTVTASTLSLRPDLQHVLRSIMPSMAYGSSFLMHGILAVAAMHKAHLQPAQRRVYTDLAVHHQTVGLEGFRVALSELSSGDADWKPCFCFATLVGLSMCWQPAGALANLAGTTPAALDFFVFMRGVDAVIRTHQSQLLHTALSPLIEGGPSMQVNLSTFE
ncbi:unnamed protein product [Clonostachys rosea f. rosea IK726]|uniref:Uncharacterized protein n=1 Tax=Clonostachys rosea f. rosea IK726 TaxID=1349383 RepID=A0ACA9U148_BIOOC|nr:unnamed protein product [Clonostachys rosea f. rosea IK726]